MAKVCEKAPTLVVMKIAPTLQAVFCDPGARWTLRNARGLALSKILANLVTTPRPRAGMFQCVIASAIVFWM